MVRGCPSRIRERPPVAAEANSGIAGMSTAPAALSLASVCRVNGRSQFGGTNTGGDTSALMIASKASSCSFPHGMGLCRARLVLKSLLRRMSVMGATSALKSFTKSRRKFAILINDRSSPTVAGFVISVSGLIFDRGGRTRDLPTKTPTA